ncbi:MAG: hypothetical protein RDV48_01025 [Candidatus Eremiobacteraeota bacterium]|nr:hypothetical protein [Candidatus Eremiobacteraeota bacterium]
MHQRSAREGPRKPAGVSLAEIVITVTLLGFIMMVLFNLYPGSIGAIRHAEHRIIAGNFAQSIIEEKRGGSYTDLDTAPAVADLKGGDDTLYHLENYEKFTISGADENIAKGIRVTVSWEEKDKRKFTITKEVYVSVVQR